MTPEDPPSKQRQLHDETRQQQDTSGGFSKSGHYDLLRDVILRAEVMSDKQTKVVLGLPFKLVQGALQSERLTYDM